MKKPLPTIAELHRTIELYNEAHRLDLEEIAAGAKPEANSLMENLYFAAADASAALGPLMRVELKAVHKK